MYKFMTCFTAKKPHTEQNKIKTRNSGRGHAFPIPTGILFVTGCGKGGERPCGTPITHTKFETKVMIPFTFTVFKFCEKVQKTLATDSINIINQDQTVAIDDKLSRSRLKQIWPRSTSKQVVFIFYFLIA